MVTTACEEADIERIVPCELRHAAITSQREAGHDAAQVADWAGTSERMVNEIYRHRLKVISDLRPATIEGLDDIASGPKPGPNGSADT
jgi:integrase